MKKLKNGNKSNGNTKPIVGSPRADSHHNWIFVRSFPLVLHAYPCVLD
jgi:hypothetical protein